MEKKPKLVPFTDSKRFVAFVKGRDEGLERVLGKYMDRIDRIVRTLRTRTHEVAAHIGTQRNGKHFAKRNRDDFENRLTQWFNMATDDTVALVRNLRRTTYVLTYAGQAEAMGRAWGRPTSCNLSRDEVRQVINRETPFSGELAPRIELAYHRLLRDVVDAFQASQVLESPIQETLDRIDRAFPTKRALPRRMAKMHEAYVKKDALGDDMPEGGFSFGVVDQQDWDDAVDDYLLDEIPNDRSPYAKVFDETKEPDEDGAERYQWEVEQQVTDDFVQSVRSGEVDAANENGITDMLWIDVIDRKTCETCCAPRDGMLSKEIEAALKSGELDAEECDAIVPPAHPWCRCRVSPATDDLPAKMPPDMGTWNDWLAMKAKTAV